MRIIEKFVKITERIVIITLIVFMVILLSIAAFEVGVIIYMELSTSFSNSNLLIDINNLMDIFGFLMIILIGFELLETIKLYINENTFHAEVILMISIIAVSRKVIILNYSKEDPIMIFAMAVLIVSLSAGYYLLKKTWNRF